MLYTYYRPEHPPYLSVISMNSKGYILQNSDTKDVHINHSKYMTTTVLSIHMHLASVYLQVHARFSHQSYFQGSKMVG